VIRWYLAKTLFNDGVIQTLVLYEKLERYVTSTRFDDFLFSCLFGDRDYQDIMLKEDFFKGSIIKYLECFYSPKVNPMIRGMVNG
jgi:hypothetical protein